MLFDCNIYNDFVTVNLNKLLNNNDNNNHLEVKFELSQVLTKKKLNA